MVCQACGHSVSSDTQKEAAEQAAAAVVAPDNISAATEAAVAHQEPAWEAAAAAQAPKHQDSAEHTSPVGVISHPHNDTTVTGTSLFWFNRNPRKSLGLGDMREHRAILPTCDCLGLEPISGMLTPDTVCSIHSHFCLFAAMSV